MSFSATLGVFVALGVVLTLLVVALRVLKRFAPSLGGARNRLPMEVVQRLPLGPKHSIAVVRVGDRVLTVAIGEGGVRPLGELDGADRAAVLATSQTPLPFEPSLPAAAGVMAALGIRPAKAAIVAAPPAPEIAAPAARVAGNSDAFRSVLGMALSSATKLAVFAAAAALLGLAPSRASAQDSTAAAPALRPLPAAAQSALVQAALRGRNSQAPAAAAGTTTPAARPLAPGATAPARAGNVDTMVARLAPQLDLRVGGGRGEGGGLRLSGTVGVVIMMGLLTLLPTLVLMMTGFTRILIVLHFLKQALGTQTAPPNHLVAALALLLSGFVMGPTLSTVNQTAVQPWLEGRMEQIEMMQVGVKPFREFMLRQTREPDLKTFVELSRPAVPPKSVNDVPLVVVMSAFVTSELRTAFQLGFALFLPFIVIDLVVSAVLMSMGMMMLPPAMIALPCKLLLFVLVDGWNLVIQSLVQSFK